VRFTTRANRAPSAFHAATERCRVVRLDDEVRVVRLDRVLDDAKSRLAREARRGSARNSAPNHAPSQRRRSVAHLEGDERRMRSRDSVAAAVPHERSRSSAPTSTPTSAAAHRESKLVLTH
jgi:hypothetical protein